MTSKKAIIQHINQLYKNGLDEYEYTSQLDRLKQLGSFASSVVFDLIQTADADKKHFLFNLLAEIGDDKTVNQLKDIITNPNMDDETKLMAAVTASQLDGYFDDYLLESNLADPQDLGKKVIENMLEKSDSPIFVQMFLENFPRMVREGPFAALEDLLLVKGDKRVVNIVGPLIEIVDDELMEYVITILMNSHDRRAFDYLQQVIKKTDSKEVQNMARHAIFKLGTYVKDDASDQEIQYKFHQAYATTSDGSGSSIYIFSVIDKDNKVRFIDFVNNDLLGIKDAFGGVFSEQEFTQFIRKLKTESGFLTTKVSPTFILEKVELAEELTKQAHRSLPVEYLAYREIFKNIEYDSKKYEKDHQAFVQFKEAALLEKDDLIEDTDDLYDYDEVSRSWFIDYELMAGPIDKYLSLEMEYSNTNDAELIINKIDNLIRQTSRRLLKKEFLTLLVDRLNEYAFLCFSGRKTERAKLAIVAAETIFLIPPEKHPFLRRMLERSFEVHLYEDDFFDEDEFDDFDDFDDDVEYDEDDYILPHFPSAKIADFQFEPKYPELENLAEIDKLKILTEKEPESAFSKFFNAEIKALDLKSRIRHVNYLESAFDIFITMNAGDFDWESFRKYLELSVPEKVKNELFQEIEELFLANMRGHNCTNIYRRIARRLWAESVYLTDGNLKPMTKPDSWAAGIEFLVGSLLFSRTPLEILETDYQISSSTIRKRREQLCDILNIKLFTDVAQKYFSYGIK